ncbi:hypothetical protein CEXT_201831 [Caerostris extrusa]|uniref:Uncharacterized protein n=1 Tax=Caerostris extrusa TaxID=172846 RepID=A0AAV4V272_CAEEX|nr:hypothetical protein CEXT_201831 [Caerostris extrusa]
MSLSQKNPSIGFEEEEIDDATQSCGYSIQIKQNPSCAPFYRPLDALALFHPEGLAATKLSFRLESRSLSSLATKGELTHFRGVKSSERRMSMG